MDRLAAYIRQLFDLAQQHVPPEAIPPSWFPAFAAVVALLFGIGICVLGAMLARWFIAVCFAAGGMAAGLRISAATSMPPAPGALIGGMIAGGMGFFLHRIWVGILAGCFLSSVALSAYSARSIVPHWVEFDQQHQLGAPDGFEVGTADAHAIASQSWEQARSYFSQFSDYLVSKVPHVRKWAALYGVLGALGGLLMGIFLCRMTLILFTSAFGTMLVGSGVAMLGQSFGMDIYGTCQQRPGITAMAMAAFFGVSVVLQALLTRPEANAKAAAA